LTVLTIFCAVFIHHAQGILHPGHPGSKTDFYRLLYIAQQYVVFVWILSVVLLGMGGLIREKSNGTSLLTLSLPVSRAHLLWARIAVGVLEAVTLAVVPWTTILLVSSAGGMPVLPRQVGFYVLLLVGGGLVYFAKANTPRQLLPADWSCCQRSYLMLGFGVSAFGA
jgi:ABC-type transport system involved in multi-copper enzyme maturation permease subunit